MVEETCKGCNHSDFVKDDKPTSLIVLTYRIENHLNFDIYAPFNKNKNIILYTCCNICYQTISQKTLKFT